MLHGFHLALVQPQMILAWLILNTGTMKSLLSGKVEEEDGGIDNSNEALVGSSAV